jgi:hypothetical protein
LSLKSVTVNSSLLCEDDKESDSTDEDAIGGSRSRRQRKEARQRGEKATKDKGKKKKTKSKIKDSSSESDSGDEGKKKEKGKRKGRRKVEESDSEVSGKAGTKSSTKTKTKTQRKRKGRDSGDKVANEEGEGASGDKTAKCKSKKPRRALEAGELCYRVHVIPADGMKVEIPLPTRRSTRRTNSSLARRSTADVEAGAPNEDSGPSKKEATPQLPISSHASDEWQPGIPSAGGFLSKSRPTSVASSLTIPTPRSQNNSSTPSRRTPSGSSNQLPAIAEN